MRARMTFLLSGQEVELREVLLREKPKSLLEYSLKGTVPVLVVGNNVIDESLEIMKWTLEEVPWCDDTPDFGLIEENDIDFKGCLDHYKYFERFPENSQEHHRAGGTLFLKKLNSRLSTTEFLGGDHMGLEDIAILPFVRQFANVDRDWFDRNAGKFISRWIFDWENSELFRKTMAKYPIWAPFQAPLFFPQEENLSLSSEHMYSFLSIICVEFGICLPPNLITSLTTSPPKNLTVLLIRIFRGEGLPVHETNDLYRTVKNRATKLLT